MSVATEDKSAVLDFARQHANTWLKLDLLYFWCKYPYAKFTAGVIARAVSCRRRGDLEEALDSLVKDNVVDKHADKGLCLYSLTGDVTKRECVLSMPTYRNNLKPALSVG